MMLRSSLRTLGSVFSVSSIGLLATGCGALLDLPDNPRVGEEETNTTRAEPPPEAMGSPGAGGGSTSMPARNGGNGGGAVLVPAEPAEEPTAPAGLDAGILGSVADADAGVAVGLGGSPVEPAPAAPLRICVVQNPTISDFTFDGGNETNAVFGASASFPGGTYFYPDDGDLDSDVSDDEWQISGVVSEVSGFGLFATGCDVIDASAFAGVSFRLSGEIESDRELVFFVESAAHQVSHVWLNDTETDPNVPDAAPNAGRCIPRTSRFDGTCREPRVTLSVSDDDDEVQILWEDLSGGSPALGVDPREITSIAWSLPDPDDDEYDIDIRIDDLRFIER